MSNRYTKEDIRPCFDKKSREMKGLNRWSQMQICMRERKNKCANLAESEIMGRSGTYENLRLQALPVIKCNNNAYTSQGIVNKPEVSRPICSP